MHPNQRLIEEFYTAFQRCDAAAMVRCYHPEIHFSDPVFPELRGEAAGAMWTMLCGRARDLKVELKDVAADEAEGRTHWEARYSFGPSKRPVHNIIEARFAFKDGLIVRHADTFDFHRWASQALGPAGWLLGWTGMMQRSVQKQAGGGLERFRSGSAA